MSALLSPPIFILILLVGIFGVILALKINREGKTKISARRKMWLGILILCWVLLALVAVLAFFQVYLWRS
jgi:hypothetical protein